MLRKRGGFLVFRVDLSWERGKGGWLSPCVVRDGCSRRVLGWAMDDTQTTRLVERALRMAHTLRCGVPDGVVFRSSHRISGIGRVRNWGSLSRWAGLGCVLIIR